MLMPKSNAQANACKKHWLLLVPIKSVHSSAMLTSFSLLPFTQVQESARSSCLLLFVRVQAFSSLVVVFVFIHVRLAYPE